MSTESLRIAEPAATSPGQPVTAPPTEADLATYLRALPQLLADGHAGRYALIKGDDVVSIWDTQRDVLQAGYERFGLEPFEIKKIDPRDPARLAALRAKEGSACPS